MSRSQVIAHRFQISDLKQDLLGRGGMGNVYRATDTHTGQPVAIKALQPEIVANAPTSSPALGGKGKLCAN